MRSANFTPSHSLKEVLCLGVFIKEYGAFGCDSFAKDVTEWAESKVWAGSQSETLLILASLGLDPYPDPDEVELYLVRYLHENGLVIPDALISAFVWLRIRLKKIIEATNAEEVEYQLVFFIQWGMNHPSRSFANIVNALSSIYWELYDEALPVFQSRASEMSQGELLVYVRNRISPWLRKLRNDD